MNRHVYNRVLLSTVLGITTLSLTALTPVTGNAATPQSTAPRSETSTTLKDAKDSKALLDVRKVYALGANDEMSALVTYKANDYAQEFPELVDFAVWFDTDGDRLPEYRLRASDPAVYKVKNWKPYGGKTVTGCDSRSQGFSATEIEFAIATDCLADPAEKFRVHVRTFFTGDEPYPAGTDNAPNAAKGWSRATSIG